MKNLRNRYKKKGFTLIEVLLAMAVASICLITIYGLLSTVLAMNQNLILQSEATTIVSSVVEDVESTPTTLTTSIRYQITLPPSPNLNPIYFDLNGNVVPNAASAVFSVSLNFQAPAANQKLGTVLSVVAYWPPYSASESTSQMIAQHSVQFTTLLDRN